MTIDQAFALHKNTVALNGGKPMSKSDFNRFATALKMFYKQWSVEEKDVDALIHHGALRLSKI